MAGEKEPMIQRADRPSAIDYDAPVSSLKLRDLVALVNSQLLEFQKYTPQPEHLKPEKEITKPEKEFVKPEKELRKPEKELLKAEKELVKPEKEHIKPEKEFRKPELSKPEKEWEIPGLDIGDLVERIAVRVVELMRK